MSCGTGMMVDGEWALRCSLSLFPNSLPVPPIYSSGQFIYGLLYLYMIPLFCSLVSLSLDAMSSVLMVFEPLKCTCIPLLLHVLLNFSPNPCMYGATMKMFLLLLLLLLLLVQFMLLVVLWLSAEVCSLLL